MPTEAQTRAWAVTSKHRHALIAAPTGSGKTLVVEGLSKSLSDEVHVLYVSPQNLQEPLELGIDDVPIRDAVRTGDTSNFERNRMRKTPPHSAEETEFS